MRSTLEETHNKRLIYISLLIEMLNYFRQKKINLLRGLLIAQFFLVEGNSRAKKGNLMIETRRCGVANGIFICSIRS